MDLPGNAFKRALASDSTPVGAWLVSGSPAAAEALGSGLGMPAGRAQECRSALRRAAAGAQSKA